MALKKADFDGASTRDREVFLILAGLLSAAAEPDRNGTVDAREMKNTAGKPLSKLRKQVRSRA